MESLLNQVIAGYRLTQFYGEDNGNMLFQVHRLKKNTTAALKLINIKDIETVVFLKNFEKFNLVKLAKILNIGTYHNFAFIIREWIDGECLQDILQKPKHDFQQALLIVEGCLKALDELHLAKCTHGNLKPQNVFLLADNTIKLTDMGLSKGNWHKHYVSPEQILGNLSNIRSDLYIVGIFLYELLAECPFSAENIISLRAISTDIPQAMEDFYQCLIAQNPQKRFPSPRAALKSLELARKKMETVSAIEDIDVSCGETVNIASLSSKIQNPAIKEKTQITQSKPIPVDESVIAKYAKPKKQEKSKKGYLQENDVVLGKYRVVGELGSGGTGKVYKVEHTLLTNNKFFALKVMHPYLVREEDVYQRFVREIEVAMSIMHKNVVPIRDFGVLPEINSPYLTMDYSDGKTLEDILQCAWIRDIDRSLNIIYQILEGLESAHSNEIVHRDLKPSNILIEKTQDGEDLVKIVDFGLAKLLGGKVKSITQGVIGTPHYMSPEQIDGGEIDQKTDIYGVGVILYQMLVGELPFTGTSFKELVLAMEKDPIAPCSIDPTIPENLERIVLKAMAKDKESRYASVEEFLEDLDEFTNNRQFISPFSESVELIPISDADIEEAKIYEIKRATFQKEDEKETSDHGIELSKPENREITERVSEIIATGEEELPLISEESMADLLHETGMAEVIRSAVGAAAKKQSGLLSKQDKEQISTVVEEKSADGTEHRRATTGGYVSPKPKKVDYNKKKYLSAAGIVIVFIITFTVAFHYYLTHYPQEEEQQEIDQKPIKEKEDRVIVIKKGWFDENMPSGMVQTTRGEYVWTLDDSYMVYVPEGSFWRGSNKYYSQKPVEQILINGYYIDKYELTNEQYRKFVEGTRGVLPSYIDDEKLGQPKQPAVGISWYDAYNYMKWVRKRLPTEAEWEKAARGGLQTPDWNSESKIVNMIKNPFPKRKYPWGNTAATKNYAHFGGKTSANVDSHPQGASPYGCIGMAGNVWEWCHDWYQKDYYKTSQTINPKGPKEASEQRVCRGGSWQDRSSKITTTYRWHLSPFEDFFNVGVRFAKSPQD